MPAVDIGFHKPPELTYPVVYMNNVVAHFKRIEFVEGEPLALFHRPVGLNLAVPFKYLVVGIEAEFCIMVYESFVDGDLLGIETGIPHPFERREYGPYTLSLGLVFAQNGNIVPLGNLLGNIPCQKFEVLVEHRLGYSMEDNPVVFVELPCHRGKKKTLAIFDGFNKILFAKYIYIPGRVFPDELELTAKIVIIGNPQSSLIACIRENILGILLLLAVDIGENLNTLHLFQGTLRINIKNLYLFYCISEKIEPPRAVIRKGKKVNETASQRKLPGLGHKIHSFERILKKGLLNKVMGQGITA
ncbi:hypothetical protein SDC9_93087 [bioreactor metagenome]|uniref:Uncharacterized protein n=1 Tax=bioreactor metagenome TaxID=1076179 RepID=A0A645A023_9ZZZZ